MGITTVFWYPTVLIPKGLSCSQYYPILIDHLQEFFQRTTPEPYKRTIKVFSVAEKASSSSSSYPLPFPVPSNQPPTHRDIYILKEELPESHSSLSSPFSPFSKSDHQIKLCTQAVVVRENRNSPTSGGAPQGGAGSGTPGPGGVPVGGSGMMSVSVGSTGQGVLGGPPGSSFMPVPGGRAGLNVGTMGMRRGGSGSGMNVAPSGGPSGSSGLININMPRTTSLSGVGSSGVGSSGVMSGGGQLLPGGGPGGVPGGGISPPSGMIVGSGGVGSGGSGAGGGRGRGGMYTAISGNDELESLLKKTQILTPATPTPLFIVEGHRFRFGDFVVCVGVVSGSQAQAQQARGISVSIEYLPISGQCYLPSMGVFSDFVRLSFPSIEDLGITQPALEDFRTETQLTTNERLAIQYVRIIREAQ